MPLISNYNSEVHTNIVVVQKPIETYNQAIYALMVIAALAS